MAAYLLPITDREPLAWIVREQRTAFGDHRVREASALDLGDVLFLYTTRGCFRNEAARDLPRPHDVERADASRSRAT